MKKLNLLQQRNMAIEELVDYYAELRKEEYRNGKKLEGIELRKKIHGLIKFIYKMDKLLSKEKIVIINDASHVRNDVPHIYACTHIGGNDVQRAFEVIGKPAYLMLGEPGILYKKLIYQGLVLNGVIPLEISDREDRKIAYNRALELLNNGGNLLIFPEGAWNVSPNEVVMKTFTGTVRLAKETGAEIVPLATEQYGNTFYFNVGKNYTISKDTTKTADELNGELRDQLATLKYEIIEHQGMCDRNSIPADHLDDFQAEIINRCNYGYGFALEDAIRERFHDKNITTEEETFACLKNIEIDQRNAFLMPHKLELSKKK